MADKLLFTTVDSCGIPFGDNLKNAYRPDSANRESGVCRDATVGAAISRPQPSGSKALRSNGNTQKLERLGRLIAAPTMAFAILFIGKLS